MGSESTPKLPVIDFSNLDQKLHTPEWDLVRTQVIEALQEYGCFEALFSKVPLDLRKALLGAAEELFDLPSQTKLRNISKKPYQGYVGQYPILPLYESMGIEDANVSEKVESSLSMFWPEGNPSFSNTIQSISERLSELDQIVRRMVLESLDLEKYLEEHMGSTNYLLRLMKYKGPQTCETKVGLCAHSDKNVVTILCQNQVEGLEVETKDGEWINVKPSPDSFIVMIGDSLLAWTNGRLHSANHRVMMTGDEVRYSTGLFSIPKVGHIIEAPKELVDEEHPLLFKPFDHAQFMCYCYTEDGRKDNKSALRRYCGI